MLQRRAHAFYPVSRYDWGTLEVVEPNGSKSVHQFDLLAGPAQATNGAYRPPLETSDMVYDGSGNLLRTVTTQVGCYHQGPTSDGTPMVPCSVTTTLNDVSPALTSTNTVTYWVGDLIASHSQTDFAGNVVNTLTNTYATGGIYQAYASGVTSNTLTHVLDRIQQTVSSEVSKGKSLTTSTTLDPRGNTRACSRYLSASTMRAKLRNPRKSTSSFSNREKILRNPLSLRKSRSISLRFL